MLLDFLVIKFVMKNFRHNFREELFWDSQQEKMLKKRMEKTLMTYIEALEVIAWDIGKNLESEFLLDLIRMAG